MAVPASSELPAPALDDLAFGGLDLRIAYPGCLLGEEFATFRSPVHWNF